MGIDREHPGPRLGSCDGDQLPVAAQRLCRRPEPTVERFAQYHDRIAAWRHPGIRVHARPDPARRRDLLGDCTAKGAGHDGGTRRSTRLESLRQHARAVVIGGGVGGASILYWLARLGWTDTVLVERARVTSGSTFHSAGLVGQLRGSLSLTQMMMNSVDLYRNLKDEVGLETGWHEVGSLRLASSQERMEELTRQAAWAKTFGLTLELISPEEAQGMFPPMTTGGGVGAAYRSTGGYIDPSQLTFALVEGARRRGAEISEDTRVTGIEVSEGQVHRVVTDRGEITTELVINAGGM